MMKTDAEIQQDVMDELKWEASLRASEIGVAVNDGVVTLSGSVGTYAQKRAAEKAAQRIQGVQAIAADIDVNLGFGSKKTDAEIAKAVANALRWDSLVPKDKIKVTVDNGLVTTEGEVLWQFEKEAVSDAIAPLNGVKGVVNLVKVRPKVQPENIRKKIADAFERSAVIDAGNIIVENDENEVTLRGTVHSFAEKRQAEYTAWNAPGVHLVKNKLRVRVPSFSSFRAL